MNLRKMLILGEPIDVNQAGIAELALIPGISSGLARRIVEFRESQRHFKTWHELRRVKGVGPVSMKSLRDYLSISHPKNNQARTTN